MPFDKSSGVAGQALYPGVSDYDAPDPGFLDTVSAAYQQDNLIVSPLVAKANKFDREFFRIDPEYDVYEDIQGYEEYADRFEQVYNPDAAASVKSDIDREIKNRKTVAAAGWVGTTLSMAAGITDPTIFVPGGALVKAGRVGYSAGRSALVVGASAAGAATIQEAGLQATQQTRTLTESGINIGGTAILGGAIGAGGAKFFSAKEWNAFGAKLETELSEEVANPADVTEIIVDRMKASAGAAAVPDIKVDDLGVAGPKVVEAIAKATSFVKMNPGIQTMFSPSVKVREVYNQMVDSPIYTKMNMEGRTLGPSTENLVKQAQRGMLSKWLTSNKGLWKESKKAAKATGEKPLTKLEFNTRVARAGRRGDVDELGNEYVTRAAQQAREQVFDPLLKRAIEGGLLPEDVKVTTAASYVTRLWNRQRLIAQEDQFRDITRRWLAGELSRAEIRAEEISTGNRIVEGDELYDRLESVERQIAGIDERIEARGRSRQSKLSDIQIAESRRLEALGQRGSASLVRAVRNSDDGKSVIDAIKDARKVSAQESKQAKTPALSMLRKRGGVRVGSKLDGELRAMGVTPKTHPGLFKKQGGLGDVDNIVLSEERFLADNFTDVDGTGYADPEDILEAIRLELAGSPVRTLDEYFDSGDLETLQEYIANTLDELGLPVDATVKQVRDAVRRVVSSGRRVDELDSRIAGLERELAEFDAATDALRNERIVTDAQAKRIKDEINDLDNAIKDAGSLVDASPRIKLIVDHAAAKRDLFRKKLSERTLRDRVNKLRAVDEASMSDDMLYELRAKESDLAKIAKDVEGLDAKVKKLGGMVPQMKKEIPEFISPEDRDQYLDEIIDGIFNNLTGKGDGEIQEWMVPVTRGPLKDRVFSIPDAMVEDFLENDMEAVLRRYTRTMGAEVELADKFGRADMRDQIAEIRQEYADLRKKAKTETERVKLDKLEERDISNLQAFRDLIRGTYRAAEENSEWSKLTRAALGWNYMRLLGGVTLTSLADAMRLIGVHGVRATMREALPALISNVQAAKIARGDARDLGAVTEVVLQTRIAQMAELNDPYRYGSTFDRYLSNTVNVFSKATGLAYWNDTVKMISSVMTQNRMARNALNWSKAGQREQAYMAKLGIDETMASRIADQINKYGTQEQGIWGANVSKWDDEYAGRVWAAALNADVDRTIVTKGVADQPLWTRTNWGRILMQFKSFGMASHQRVLLSGLQEYPHRFAEQMVLGTTLGMMIAYLKYVERGDVDRAQNLVENPGLWIADGLDRTGILFLPFEVSNTADKLSANYGGPNIGIAAGISSLAGDKDGSGGVSRYASRNAAGTLGGPSLGIIEDLVNIAAGLGDGRDGLTTSQSNAIIRQIPGATLPGARSAVHVGLKPALQ